MTSPRLPTLRPYAIAAAALTAATLIRLAVDPLVGNRVPFATFYMAVMAVAFVGSLGAAILTVAVSTVAGS